MPDAGELSEGASDGVVIRARNLRKVYGEGDTAVEALADVSRVNSPVAFVKKMHQAMHGGASAA